MSHSYLFTGNSYRSAEDAAIARANAYITHPLDLLLVTNEHFEPNPKKRENASLTVDAVRAAIRELSASPFGTTRAAVFPHADGMTHNAQNALLKTLEEPPAGVQLYLVSENPVLLLPTIRSRCETVSVDAELSISENPVQKELSELINRMTIDGKSSDKHRVISFLAEKKDSRKEILDELENIFRQKLLQNDSVHDTVDIGNMLKKIAVARKQATANVNWNAVVYGLFRF